MSDVSMNGEVVCAIGVFDGMHLGHQYLLGQAAGQARQLGLPLLVATFDRDPDELFKPGAQQSKLLSDAERVEYLRQVASQVLVLPFDRELAGLSPEGFLTSVLAAHCTPRAIHVGVDFRFGAQAAGDVGTLAAWAAGHGAEAFGHELLDDGGQPVSATRIRDCLASGDLAEANRLLTRPHHLRGQIVRGRGFGRELGFPTANIAVLDGVMKPADGVYAGFFKLGDELLAAAISVGVPLTFGDLEATLEVYVLDYEGDLYEKEATVYFIERLRPMIAFPDTAELMAQIAQDVEDTRRIAAEARPLMA